MPDESVPFDDVEESVVWIADSGLFIACDRQQNIDIHLRLKPEESRALGVSGSQPCFRFLLREPI
jgi:hypothetical protein